VSIDGFGRVIGTGGYEATGSSEIGRNEDLVTAEQQEGELNLRWTISAI
jgi:hypothetical protein